MISVPFFQVDAFTAEPFRGNPAAVCSLDSWLSDDAMQSIAAENNLSETAFFVARDDGDFDLRWFTPTVEVDLCGHATLASAFVVMNRLNTDLQHVVFHTRSGRLSVDRDSDLYTLDLPRLDIGTPASADDMDHVAAAIGRRPVEMYSGSSWLAVMDSDEEIATLRPDFGAIAMLPCPYVIVTALSSERGVDFASRYFAPGSGIPEDPVTGSIHARLTPYWARRLGKKELQAAQLSARGGRLACTLSDDRVSVGGRAVLVIEGTLNVTSS